MLIRDLVVRSGMTKDTIRFYEKRGLISLKEKNRLENNYKDYPDEVLNKLLLIRDLKDLNLTLTEIDTFLHLWANEDASCENIRFVLENKLAEVDDQIRKLNAVRQKVSSSLSRCRNDACEFEKQFHRFCKKNFFRDRKPWTILHSVQYTV